MEYNRKIDYWGLPDDEYLTHETIQELMLDYMDNNFGHEIPKEITVYGYAIREIKKEWWAEWLIEKLIEEMDQDYMIDNGKNNSALCDDSAIKEMALELMDLIIDVYEVGSLDKVCEKTIKTADYELEEKC